MDPDEFDYSIPDIFDMAFRGDFGKAPSVRRASSVASTATCSTSQNPLDGWPGRPTPPSGPSVAPTQMRTISPSSAADLQIVPYDGPRGPTLTKLWTIWVPSTAIQFFLVPTRLQVLYVAGVSFGWNVRSTAPTHHTPDERASDQQTTYRSSHHAFRTPGVN